MNFERFPVQLGDEDFRKAKELAEARAALKRPYKDQRYTKLDPVQTELHNILGEVAVAKMLGLKYSTHKRRTRSAYRSDFKTDDGRPVGLWVKTSAKKGGKPYFRPGMRFPLNKMPFVFVDVESPFRPTVVGWAFTNELLGLIDRSSRTVALSDLHAPSKLKEAVQKAIDRTEPGAKPFEIKYAPLDSLL